MMVLFEYKVVPAPRRGEKAKGIKTTSDRFAHALGLLMNRLGQDGWEYMRADTLPCDERIGLTGTRTKTTYQSMLVFRRALAEGAERQSEPAGPSGLLVLSADDSNAPALGAAIAPVGSAPALGPAKGPDLAAE
jgi:hypothetical protein